MAPSGALSPPAVVQQPASNSQIQQLINLLQLAQNIQQNLNETGKSNNNNNNNGQNIKKTTSENHDITASL